MVEVDAQLVGGAPRFTVMGSSDPSSVEARDRIRAAMLNSGEDWPDQRVAVTLAPVGMAKPSADVDAAIACALLVAAGALPAQSLADTAVIGGLGLDGGVRLVRGVLARVIAAAEAGFRTVVVPDVTSADACLVPGVAVRGVESLRELLVALRGEPTPARRPANRPRKAQPDAELAVSAADLADVPGQKEARRALEVCAAGGHHLLLTGPVGAPLRQAAACLPSILPPLTDPDALQAMAMRDAAERREAGAGLLTRAPLECLDPTATVTTLVGRGSGHAARPGAVSLAHHGVLALHDAPNAKAEVLRALHASLGEDEVRTVHPTSPSRMPARFQLVMTALMCPCGATGSLRPCVCRPAARQRHLARLANILDRVPVRAALHSPARPGRGDEASAVVADRVTAARERMATRLAGTRWLTNADVPGRELRARWRPAANALPLLEAATQDGRLDLRSADEVMRVAWTVADLARHRAPTARDVRQALDLKTNLT